MDATRPRCLRDRARQGWYARWRSARFARHLGFSPAAAVVSQPEVALPLRCAGWLIRLARHGATMRLCG
jgi:hypothetical protein